MTAGRQVRLDDDVADFVAGEADGKSLSSATNRLLRELARTRPGGSPSVAARPAARARAARRFGPIGPTVGDPRARRTGG